MDKKTFEENLKYNDIAWDFKKFVEDSITKSFEGITYDDNHQILVCNEEFYKRNGYSKISVDVGLPTSGYGGLEMIIDLRSYDIYHKRNMRKVIKEEINRCFNPLYGVPGSASYRITIHDFEIWKRFRTMKDLESEISRLNETYKNNGIKIRYDVNKYINEFGGKFSIEKHTGNNLGSKSTNKNIRFLKIFDKFINDTISEYIKSNKRDGKLLIDLD